MIDRRTLIVGGLAFGAAAAVPAAAASGRKRDAIDAIVLPPGFNGVFAYGRGGKVEHIRCVGMADVEAGRPVTPLTSYKWGSASKWLASTATLRLVEQGKLSLDTSVRACLPEFLRDTGERVLVKHLLSNTSGIPDLLNRQLRAEPALRFSTASAEAIVRRFGMSDLAFAPGEGWDYAALNWVILAAVLERLTGEPLAALVTRLVLQPLRMRGAGFAQADQPPMPQLAAAYTSAVPPVRKMLPVPPFLAGSGNVAGTVRDAMRAAHGIFHGTLLSGASRRELTTIRWPDEEYALGGRVRWIDGDPWAWESGRVEGYRAHIAHRLGRSETVVFFNTTDMAQPQIGEWVKTIARA